MARLSPRANKSERNSGFSARTLDLSQWDVELNIGRNTTGALSVSPFALQNADIFSNLVKCVVTFYDSTFSLGSGGKKMKNLFHFHYKRKEFSIFSFKM